MKTIKISQDVMDKMPRTRRATFWEALWNRLSGKLLWWLVVIKDKDA